LGGVGIEGIGRGQVCSAEARFDDFAAAEAPECAEDVFGKGLFEEGRGLEFIPEVGAEFVVLVEFVGGDRIAGGEEAEGSGVRRGAGFAGVGARAGGGLRVVPVGVDLSWCWHGESPVSVRFWGLSLGPLTFRRMELGRQEVKPQEVKRGDRYPAFHGDVFEAP
jgi:hypothetical protein